MKEQFVKDGLECPECNTACIPPQKGIDVHIAICGHCGAIIMVGPVLGVQSLPASALLYSQQAEPLFFDEIIKDWKEWYRRFGQNFMYIRLNNMKNDKTN